MAGQYGAIGYGRLLRAAETGSVLRPSTRSAITLAASGVPLRIAPAMVSLPVDGGVVDTKVLSAQRRIRRNGLIALAGLVVWGVVGLPFIVFPTVDPVPRHADVVLMLGPPSPQRVALAERLLDDGTVGAALISVPLSSVPQRLDGLCDRAHVTCFAPDPSTTRGEARMLGRTAERSGWTSAVVVAMPAHVTRARTIVQRCFAGHLSMVATDEGPLHGWPYQYAYQTAATVKAWLNPGC